MSKSGALTLLTDFGDADGYVGTMKGVMLSIAPEIQFVDLSHQIDPQNIKQAAFALMIAAPFFPDGTVHLIVVDPGVGSQRRAIAAETPQARFVAPDNGVLSYVLANADSYVIHELANRDYQLPFVSATFHGRDIFSPAAAHLASGVSISEFGPKVESPVLLAPPLLKIDDKVVEGEVLNIDHFGNVRSSIHQLTWDDDRLQLQPSFGEAQLSMPVSFEARSAVVEISSVLIEGISSTFSAVETGSLLAVVGSEGGLEIAINQGNAAQAFGAQEGDRIRLHLKA